MALFNGALSSRAHGVVMRRRLAVVLTAACLVTQLAVPSAAFAEGSDATCRVEITTVHQRLRGFGVAHTGGTIDVVAAVTCLDLAQQPYVTRGTASVEIRDPSDGTWQDFGAWSACSAGSTLGVSAFTCSASAGYSDPDLTFATFRGCFDLEAPVDLPVKCSTAVTTP